MNLSDFGELDPSSTASPHHAHGNESEHFINIPAVVYVGILSTLGTIGNTTVLYIYTVKFKQNAFNTFIIFLAAFDIICSAVEMPLDVVNMLHLVHFAACKPIVITATTTALATGFLLIAIAVIRYKGVCQPLKPNISVLQARVISLVSLVIAICISWPSAVMITNVPEKLQGGMIVVSCEYDSYFKNTLYPLIFNGILFLVFASAFVTLITLYSIIGRRLWLRKKYGPSLTSVSTQRKIPTTKEAYNTHDQRFSENVIIGSKKDNYDIYYNCTAKSNDRSSLQKEKRNSNSENFSLTSARPERCNVPISVIVESDNGSSTSTVSNNSSLKLVPMKKKSKFTIQNTFKTLFIVTVIFLLSYLPHLSLMIAGAVGSDLDVTPLGQSFIGILIRSYLISSASNPIIYGCYNNKFRAEITKLYNDVRSCFVFNKC